MAFLVGIGLLAAFSAALLNPYGRRVLGVMFLVGCGIAVAIGIGIWMIARNAAPYQPVADYPYGQSAAQADAKAAASAATAASAAAAQVAEPAGPPPDSAFTSPNYTSAAPSSLN